MHAFSFRTTVRPLSVKKTGLLATAALIPLACVSLSATAAWADPTPECNANPAHVRSTECGVDSETFGYSSTAVGDSAKASQSATAVGADAQASSGGTAVGASARAIGQDSIVLGDGAALNAKGIAIGDAAITYTEGSIAIGGAAIVNGASGTVTVNYTPVPDQAASVSIGDNSRVNGYDNVALGSFALVGRREDSSRVSRGTSVGAASNVSAEGGTALGARSSTSGVNATAVGTSARAAGENSVALGGSGLSLGDNSIAIGSHSIARSEGSIAIGRDAFANDIVGAHTVNLLPVPDQVGSVTIGDASRVSGYDSLALGGFAVVGVRNSFDYVSRGTSVGAASNVSAEGGTALGARSSTSGVDAIAIGAGASATTDRSIVMGGPTTVAGSADAVAIGTNSNAGGGAAVAIGLGQTATGNGAVAIGDPNTAVGTGAVAIGADNTATGDGAVALGNATTATGSGAVAMGNGATALADGSVAIGGNALASGQNSVALGVGSVADQDNVVSIGAAGSERRLVNLADGVTDTDGVNVRQLNTAIAGASGAAAAAQGTANTALANAATAQGTANTALANAATAQGTANTALAHADSLGSATAAVLGGGAAYDAATGAFTAPSYTMQGATYHDIGSAFSAVDASLNSFENRLEAMAALTDRGLRQATGGVAAAMALGGAMVVPDSQLSVSLNISTYRDEQGFSGNVVWRAAPRVYLNGGIASSTVRGTTGGRIGIAFGF